MPVGGPGQAQTTAAYAKKALRHLARRYQTLDAEINQLEADIRRLCARANPALLAAKGVGPDTASVLLAAAGDNPGRMKSEKSFAATAKPTRRYGRCATTRMRTDTATQQYVERRQAQGKKKREIIRCLKRHIAPQIYRLLTNPPPTPNCARLRTRRQQAGITITQAAQQIRTHPSRISALELGRDHNHHLATRYQTWLRTHQPHQPGPTVDLTSLILVGPLAGDRSDPLTNWPLCLFYDLSACLRPGDNTPEPGSGVT